MHTVGLTVFGKKVKLPLAAYVRMSGHPVKAKATISAAATRYFFMGSPCDRDRRETWITITANAAPRAPQHTQSPEPRGNNVHRTDSRRGFDRKADCGSPKPLLVSAKMEG
jgi:hypothetical protein